MKRALVSLAAIAAVLVAPGARAAGFSLDTQSARTVGMAGAATGLVDDASAIYFNPAGIVQGRVLDAQANGTLVLPSSTYTDAYGNSTTTPFRLVPTAQAYVAGGITKDFSAGIGVFEPFGLQIGWPANWEGRSLITYASLATYDVNPTLAYRLGPMRVGAGVQIVASQVDFERDIALPNGQYGTSQLGGTAWGVGGNVGIQVDAIPKVLSFGAHYRSAVELSFDGNAHFDGIPSSLAGTLHDQPGATRVVLPDSFAFGIAAHPVPKLALDLDVVYFDWSFFRSIDIAFPNDATNTLASTQPKRWQNTVNLHLGGEWAPTDAWRARLGAMYDPSPSPGDTLTPDLPDSTRLAFSAGGGWRAKNGLKLDVGYELVLLLSRDSTAPQLPGSYSGFANVVSLGIGWTTPTKK